MDVSSPLGQRGSMKTLFLTSTLPRFHGDMQANFVGEQAQAWIAARAMDEIVILAPHDAGITREERIGRVRIERFRYLVPERWQNLAYPAILPNIQRNPMLALQVPFFLAAEYRSAKRIARRMKPDLVYAHWVMPQGLVAWRLKRKAGTPYVLQNHSSDLATYLKLGRAGKAMARAVLGDAAHFFCVNAAQRDFALGLFDGAERGAFATRCTVLPMGIAGLREVAIPQQVAGFEIATIGRLSRKKGLNYLIEAAELLAQKGIRPSIGIAGDGEDRAMLEALVKQADVTFTGFLVGEEKERFLQTAQRFAFPARAADGDVEGLPVAMLEALCRRRPVLASRDTNIELLPEWRRISDCVTFVENPMDVAALAQGLERLLQSDPARAEAAAEVMGRYRWDRLIGEYLDQIEAALLAAK
jgi:glycosyltransferase involved in cell wall biosynthesis